MTEAELYNLRPGSKIRNREEGWEAVVVGVNNLFDGRSRVSWIDLVIENLRLDSISPATALRDCELAKH